MNNSQLVIDGKSLALKHQQSLKAVSSNSPRVVTFFNPDDPSSKMFTMMKLKKANELGIVFDPIEISPNITTAAFSSLINGFNRETKVNGIMIQLPLPTALRKHTEKLIQLIDPKKDVDGMREDSPFLAATVRGVLTIINEQSAVWRTINNLTVFAVVGSEGFIGKRMVKGLKEKLKVESQNIVEVDEKKTNSNLSDLKNADVVISCVGTNNLIMAEHVKPEFIGIDVGLGDFSNEALAKSSAYTPKIGGVGPMTIISLMENIFDATSS